MILLAVRWSAADAAFAHEGAGVEDDTLGEEAVRVTQC